MAEREETMIKTMTIKRTCISFLTGIFFISALMFLGGCGQAKAGGSRTPEKANIENSFQSIDDTQLAKAILKREKPEVEIPQDPFRPLFNKNKDAPSVEAKVTEANIMNDVKYVGLMKFDDQYSALLITKFKKEVYQVDDKIRDFTIIDIQEEEVILSDGDKILKLKRGENN